MSKQAPIHPLPPRMSIDSPYPSLKDEKVKLEALKSEFAICRFLPKTPLPDWVAKSKTFSITRTPEELSIVCENDLIPTDIQEGRNPEVRIEAHWNGLKVVGPLDFGLTGILASIAQPLADSKISIFAISTFDTDIILVRSPFFTLAQKVLVEAGFEII